MYKLSQFTVAKSLEDHHHAEHVLVFNTFTGRSVVVETADWARVVGALGEGEVTDPQLANSIASLAKGGFVRPVDFDERGHYQQVFDARRLKPERIFPILAVTTTCNIGCSYCYEEGVIGKKMKPEVVDGVLRWIERRFLKDGIGDINPSLFGGEPLLYPEVLIAILDGFNELRDKHGLTGTFYSSSNGVLMTPELAGELAAKGLGMIQISLDGPERVHNERRHGKRGESTFAESLRGLRYAVDAIDSVTVKVNFDRHNRDSIEELYDFLVAENLAERVEVKLETIAYQIGSSTVHDPAYVMPPESPELADAYLELMLSAQRRGIRVRKDTAHTTPCMFTSQHGVIIGPRGNIYKCISLVGREEFKVGTVFDEDYLEQEYRRQMDGTKKVSECFDEACPYVPVCHGGCAYESIARTGRYDERYCTKDYLESFHYKRYLLHYEKKLERMGVDVGLNVEHFRQTAVSPEAAKAGCGGGCGGG